MKWIVIVILAFWAIISPFRAADANIVVTDTVNTINGSIPVLGAFSVSTEGPVEIPVTAPYGEPASAGGIISPNSISLAALYNSPVIFAGSSEAQVSFIVSNPETYFISGTVVDNDYPSSWMNIKLVDMTTGNTLFYLANTSAFFKPFGQFSASFTDAVQLSPADNYQLTADIVIASANDSATVNLHTIPESPTVLLLACGLVGLMAYQRRFQKS
jgi:hypothetical protein